MKIRNPRLLRMAGWLATQTAHGLFRTLQFDYRYLGAARGARDVPASDPGRYLYSIWHEKLLLPAIHFGHPSLAVLISKHADGQLLGSLITSMGMGMVLGSSSRDGLRAVRQLVRDEHARRHLAVTPDGPRGPRRVVQPGIIYIASLTGMAIVPVGVGYHRPWQMNSWDRFAIPKPGSRARCLADNPIVIPPRLRTEDLEPYRLQVQQEMDRLNTLAEQWAETNRLPAVATPGPQVRAA